MSEKDAETIRDAVSDENPESGANAPAAAGALHCPRCGGQAIREWSRVSTFVCMTFCISLFLTPVLFRACTSGAGPILFIPFVLCAGIALLSFWAMPAVGAIAVLARSCCPDCGHPYPTVSAGSHQSTEAPFPRWSAVIGSFVVLVTLVACLVWLRTAPGLETWGGGLTYYSRVVIAGFVLSFGLLAQALLWRRLRTRMTNGVRRSLLLMPTILLATGWLALTMYDHNALSRKYDPVSRAPRVLDRAGLAALPTSAREVKVHSWAFLFSGEFALRYAADPNVIEQFLAASPSLEGVTCRTYSAESMRLPARSYDDIFADVFDDGRADGHEYFDPNIDVLPDWYQKSIRGPGRRYEVSWYDGKYQGELIVDDEDHTVYVHVSRY